MNPHIQVHIEVNKLNFKYGTDEILKEISFKVRQGGFMAILGPNGSGKSTLLKNISTVLTPDKGKVLLSNEDIFKIRPKELARKMAVVPQDTVIQFPFTVLETVMMGRMPHQRRFQSESVQDFSTAKRAMKLTSTWHLKDRLVTEISGGERQRVIVARALAQEPQVILLDEPTAHLDLQHQIELLELLQNLNHHSQVTVLAVLHDLNLAAQFSDYVLLMHRGKIFASGAPGDVLTAENIQQVYGIEVLIFPNELTGRFNIIPVSRSVPKLARVNNYRIHMICGGGTGEYIMEKLVQYGYIVSCGVLNVGDSDWRKAKTLGVEMVEEAPFTGVRPEVYKKNQALINRADAVVVMPIPFGLGNLGNLQQARNAGLEGKVVILVGDGDMGKRDFTGGKAIEVYREMDNHAHVVISPRDIFPLLAGLSGKQSADNKN